MVTARRGRARAPKRSYWDARYGSEELVWGRAPNRFLVAELENLEPRGRALDLACGEGRNALWLADLGWQVTGVDFSTVAIERGRQLAGEHHSPVCWIEADVTRWRPEPASFELVIVLYLHLPAADFDRVLATAADALVSGGVLVGVGHALSNLECGIGGPQDPEILWEYVEIARRLTSLGLEVDEAKEVRRPVETPEGEAQALDALIRARRP